MPWRNLNTHWEKWPWVWAPLASPGKGIGEQDALIDFELKDITTLFAFDKVQSHYNLMTSKETLQ